MAALRANYHRILDKIELMLPAKLRPLYNHPAGPKTVFFWAPVFKWGLVGAGLADMTRPAEKLSTSQSAVLTATGTNRIRRQKSKWLQSPECFSPSGLNGDVTQSSPFPSSPHIVSITTILRSHFKPVGKVHVFSSFKPPQGVREKTNRAFVNIYSRIIATNTQVLVV
uniref:Mitochondrial pyruvate carrier n=1 Tax=Gasterosteus aculeatus aculeatus TaxID=481459 RepID=A0AAQ4QW56_GASAC